jgi:hypothetical protein
LVVISEFLRSQQGIQQVDHQPDAYQQHDDRFSIHIDLASGDPASANSIAELDITKRQQEERYRDHDKDQVLHGASYKRNFYSRLEFYQYGQVRPILIL